MQAALWIASAVVLVCYVLYRMHRNTKRHGAAFNVLLGKYTYSLLNESDKKKVEYRTAEILNQAMRGRFREFNSETERYGWYALAMRELGIPPAVEQYPRWNLVPNPFAAILPGDPALTNVSAYMKAKFGIEVTVGTDHKLVDEIMAKIKRDKDGTTQQP
jgi:hypothetical protein